MSCSLKLLALLPCWGSGLSYFIAARILSWMILPHSKAHKSTNWKIEWLWIGYLLEETFFRTQKSAHSAFHYGMCLEMETHFCTHRGWRKRSGDGSQKRCDIGTLRAFNFWKTILIFCERWHRIIRFNLAKITMHLLLISVVSLAVPVLAGCRATVEKDQLRAESCAPRMPKDEAEQLFLSPQEHKRGSPKCLCEDTSCCSH